MHRRSCCFSAVRRLVLALALVSLVAGVWPAHAEINVWEDEEGVLIMDSRRAPREKDSLVISDNDIETKPMPEGTDVEEFRRLYQRGTDILKEVVTDLRYNKYDVTSRAKLIAFNNYLNIKAPDLELPPSTQNRVSSLEGVARVARNMVEGQRDEDAIKRLKAKSLYCESLATKLKWDIWIRTYEAPIDIVELDESLCTER